MRNKEKGFSLIELMITVSIMGILSAIAIPAYQTYISKAKTADLMSASHIGQLMVAEYIQTTSATDCTNMPGQLDGSVLLPISSSNIRNAIIDALNVQGFGSCAVIVSANSGRGGLVRLSAATADQLGWMPEMQMASYDSLAIENDAIPSVELVQSIRISAPVQIYSIPSFNADGSISWAVYSNGVPGAPASLPVLAIKVVS